MKTATLFIAFILGANQFCSAKGCVKEIYIGSNYWRSSSHTSEESIDPGDSLKIFLSVWGGDCNSGSYECWLIPPINLYKDSILIASFSTPYYIKDTGNYYCTANYLSCGSPGQFDVSVHVKYAMVGINELSEKNNFNVFPVPSSNYISIHERIKDLVFYDLSGKEIFHVKNPDESIDITDFLSGYYLIVGTTYDDKKLFSKMIKE